MALRGVSYDSYAQMRDVSANRHLRMTYHNGTLEIMSPQYRHEKPSRRIGLVVLAVTAVLGIPCEGNGSTTFRRRGARTTRGWGKEPDQSFYLAHEPQIHGKDEIDLEIDPPPDLSIEVDHRGRSHGRLPLYAALHVPEVWQFHTRKKQLRFLQFDGTAYVAIERSLALPMLALQDVSEALDLGTGLAESEWDSLLRKWVSARFVMP
jgi:Uma2 family endonuclease